MGLSAANSNIFAMGRLHCVVRDITVMNLTKAARKSTFSIYFESCYDFLHVLTHWPILSLVTGRHTTKINVRLTSTVAKQGKTGLHNTELRAINHKRLVMDMLHCTVPGMSMVIHTEGVRK